MGFATISRRLTRRRTQLTVFSALVCLCLLAVTFIGTQVFMKLDDYASSHQDNVPWSLSQLEVDQLKYLGALRSLNAQHPETMAELNRRFDALYSRAGTVAVGRVYEPIQQDSRARAALVRVQTQIFAMEEIMDSTDAEILASAPRLIQMTQDISDPIRRLMAFVISKNAALKEQERDALMSKLIQVTALSVLLLVAMASLGFLLWQLYRLYRQRALENRQTLNRLSTILDTSQDAVVVVRPDGGIIDTNRAANDMFFAGQAPAEDTMISSILKRKTPDGTLSQLSGEKLLASCQEGPNLCSNLVGVTHTGEPIAVEMSADTAQRGGQDVVICFLRNISRRLADQAALLDARDRALSAQQAKARFLSAISHEMRTPLTGILGALDLLDGTSLSPKQRSYTQIMQSSGQVLLNQINDALDRARTGQGAVELSNQAFDLDDMLDMLLRSQRPMAHKAGNALSLSPTSQSLGVVHGDRGRVYQVVLNLVSNAIKYTQNGEITLEVCRASQAQGTSGDMVEIQVTDTGIGIPEDDIARIFEDFVRLDAGGTDKAEGTGLGLGIVRNLVVLMGGDIGVESEPGEGSLFWVRLPLPDAARIRSTTDLAEVAKGPTRQDILVVEDNEINRTVLAELLEKEGHLVWTAEDGADAVSQAEKQRFDTIVMDINMPVMDGLTATRSIRGGQGRSCGSRIIALSAHLSPETETQLLKAGMDAALTKPLRRGALTHALIPIEKALPGSRQDETALMDPVVLDQLTGALDPQSLCQLLDGFYLQGQTLLDDLPTLKGDALPARLHDFAGLAATLGARGLHAALSQGEFSLKAGDSKGTAAALAALPGLWADTCQSLDRVKSAA